jgi:hypothetical protein
MAFTRLPPYRSPEASPAMIRILLPLAAINPALLKTTATAPVVESKPNHREHGAHKGYLRF